MFPALGYVLLAHVITCARRVMLCYERHVETNTRLEAAGVEVIRISGSELGARAR